MTDTTSVSETGNHEAFMSQLEGGLFHEASAELPVVNDTNDLADATNPADAASAADMPNAAEPSSATAMPAGEDDVFKTQLEGGLFGEENRPVEAEGSPATRAEDREGAEEVDAPAGTHQGPPQMRFRPANDERTIEAARMMKAGLTYDEVQEVLTRRNGRTADEEPQEEEVPNIGAMQTRLAELDRVLDQAGEDESIMTMELARTIRERGDLAAELKLAQREAEARAEARALEEQNIYQTQFEESTGAVLELYPEAQRPDSELSRRIGAEVQEILSTPGHPLTGNPEAPMILAVKHARALGIAPQTGPRPSGAREARGGRTADPHRVATRTLNPASHPAEATWPRSGLTPATGASRTAPPGIIPTAAAVEAELHRRFADARSDDEAAGLLAAGLFGAASPVNPFA